MIPMYKNLTDSHFHILEMKKKHMDTESVIQKCQDQGFFYMIDIGVNEENLSERLHYSETYPIIRHTAGIHPNYASGDIETRMAEVERSLQHKSVIGLGETGLDYFRDNTSKRDQILFFIKHLDLGEQYDLPVIIHNRDACDDILKVLKERDFQGRGIIHCYSSTPENVSEFLNYGMYISFAGNVTYPKNTLLQDALKAVPLDRLLIETDSPYLAPQKKRGKNNSPEYIGYTAEFAAKLLSKSTEEIINKTAENLCRLFKLPQEIS